MAVTIIHKHKLSLSFTAFVKKAFPFAILHIYDIAYYSGVRLCFNIPVLKTHAQETFQEIFQEIFQENTGKKVPAQASHDLRIATGKCNNYRREVD